MIRHNWTARKLARHVRPIFQNIDRPGIVFRVRADQLPPVPFSEYAYRWYHLREHGWPTDLVNRLQAADLHWKYLDIWTPRHDHPHHVLFVFRGYNGVSPRPELAEVATLIGALQARGARVEVA